MNGITTTKTIFEYLDNTPSKNVVVPKPVEQPPANGAYYATVTASVVIGVDEFIREVEGLKPQRYSTKVTFNLGFKNYSQAVRAQRNAARGYKDKVLQESGYFFCNDELVKIQAFIQSKLRKELTLIKIHAVVPESTMKHCPPEICDLSSCFERNKK